MSNILHVCLALLIAGCSDTGFQGGSSKPSPQPAAEPQLESADVQQPLQEVDQLPPATLPPVSPPSVDDNPTVTTAGSFRAWAEPPTPARGMAYEIVLEVTLPSTVVSYGLSDLSGTLQGTDFYSQTIGANAIARFTNGRSEPVQQQFNFYGNSARIRIPVPGAYQPLTVDTVTIRSQVLNEEQVLRIQFQGWQSTIGFPGFMPPFY